MSSPTFTTNDLPIGFCGIGCPFCAGFRLLFKASQRVRHILLITSPLSHARTACFPPLAISFSLGFSSWAKKNARLGSIPGESLWGKLQHAGNHSKVGLQGVRDDPIRPGYNGPPDREDAT